jgi:hypothetical protein
MNDYVVVAGSAAVVALMVGIAWALGFRQAARIDADELARLLDLSEPGARLEEAAISNDGRAALARVSGGKMLVAKAMGGDISARIYPLSDVQVRRDGGRIVAAFADLGFPNLGLRLERPPPWLVERAQGGAN